MSNRRKIYAAIVVGVCVLAATVIVVHQGGAASQTESDLKQASLAGWPADQTWSWSYQLPSDMRDGDGISLRLRSRSSTLAAGENISFSPGAHPMHAADAEQESMAGYILPLTAPSPRPSAGTVVIQLLDLSKIGAVSTKAGQDLRVIGKLSVGGITIELSGNAIFLPAGHIVGNAPQREGHWLNHELYLMSFWVQQDRAVTQYDVLVQCEAVPKAQR